jgi:hypothetical protein
MEEQTMADRSSAEIFGEVFDYLAKTGDVKAARHFFKLTQRYDFSLCQMECDKSLVKLGLARKAKDEDGYTRTVYFGDEDF